MYWKMYDITVIFTRKVETWNENGNKILSK